MPETTLKHLADEALTVQRKTCIFHNPLNTALCTDYHRCGRDTIPTKTVQVLSAHEYPVLFLQFSHDGKYLASASEDHTAIIWEVVREDYLRVKYTLRHSGEVHHVAWSPDDTMLLTCVLQEAVRVWDVETGECKHTCAGELLGGRTCDWLPDGKRYATADGDGRVHIWDLQGKETDGWEELRTFDRLDMAVTGDGALIVVNCGEFSVYNMELEAKLERVIKEESQSEFRSLSVSKDGRYVLLQLGYVAVIRVWDLTEDEEASKPVEYRGHQLQQAENQACFGGSDEAFVLSGSWDGHVYIWHRATGQLVDALPGHEGILRSVCWNPASPHMFASGSDDSTIRVWAWNK